MISVLLVTIQLIGRSGTEVVCYETAHGLRKRKYDVSIYTRHAGPLAKKLLSEGFQVFTDLAEFPSVPAVIQANQSDPLLDAVAKFPDVPVISICHDAVTWFSEPVDLPTIRRHVAVDLACRARIAKRIPHFAERIELLQNAVELDRFLFRPTFYVRRRIALHLSQ